MKMRLFVHMIAVLIIISTFVYASSIDVKFPTLQPTQNATSSWVWTCGENSGLDDTSYEWSCGGNGETGQALGVVMPSNATIIGLGLQCNTGTGTAVVEIKTTGGSSIGCNITSTSTSAWEVCDTSILLGDILIPYTITDTGHSQCVITVQMEDQINGIASPPSSWWAEDANSLYTLADESKHVTIHNRTFQTGFLKVGNTSSDENDYASLWYRSGSAYFSHAYHFYDTDSFAVKQTYGGATTLNTGSGEELTLAENSNAKLKYGYGGYDEWIYYANVRGQLREYPSTRYNSTNWDLTDTQNLNVEIHINVTGNVTYSPNSVSTINCSGTNGFAFNNTNNFITWGCIG